MSKWYGDFAATHFMSRLSLYARGTTALSSSVGFARPAMLDCPMQRMSFMSVGASTGFSAGSRASSPPDSYRAISCALESAFSSAAPAAASIMTAAAAANIIFFI